MQASQRRKTAERGLNKDAVCVEALFTARAAPRPKNNLGIKCET